MAVMLAVGDPCLIGWKLENLENMLVSGQVMVNLSQFE